VDRAIGVGEIDVISLSPSSSINSAAVGHAETFGFDFDFDFGDERIGVATTGESSTSIHEDVTRADRVVGVVAGLDLTTSSSLSLSLLSLLESVSESDARFVSSAEVCLVREFIFLATDSDFS
jgi:hypothetical protein